MGNPPRRRRGGPPVFAPLDPPPPPTPVVVAVPAREVRFDAPRSTEIEALLAALSAALGKEIPPGWGYALQIFKTVASGAEEGATFYISSCGRAELRRVLKELVTKL